MIKEAYCSKEVSILLKEKGFNEATNRYYNAQHDEIRTVSDTFMTYWNSEEHMKVLMMEGALAIPTHQMAMKWLREEKRTSIIIEFDLTKRGYCPYVYQLDYDMEWVVKWRINTPMKYEEAVEAALKYSLENLI